MKCEARQSHQAIGHRSPIVGKTFPCKLEYSCQFQLAFISKDALKLLIVPYNYHCMVSLLYSTYSSESQRGRSRRPSLGILSLSPTAI